jgi:hypothetical protein
MKPTALLYEIVPWEPWQLLRPGPILRSAEEKCIVLSLGEPKVVLAKALVLNVARKALELSDKTALTGKLGLPQTAGDLHVADITDIPSWKRDAIFEARTRGAIEWITTNPSKITHARMLKKEPVDGEENDITWRVELMEDNYSVMTADSRGILTRFQATESEKKELREKSDPALVAKWRDNLKEEPQPKAPLFEEGDKPDVKRVLKTLQKRGRMSIAEIEAELQPKGKRGPDEMEIGR